MRPCYASGAARSREARSKPSRMKGRPKFVVDRGPSRLLVVDEHEFGRRDREEHDAHGLPSRELRELLTESVSDPRNFLSRDCATFPPTVKSSRLTQVRGVLV